MIRRIVILLASLLAGLAAYLSSERVLFRTFAQTSSQANPSSPGPGQFKFIGVASCSASACHGSSGTPGTPGSEYTTWVTRDKHARAHEALFNAVSVRIMNNLTSGKMKAHEDSRCLSCHVMPEYEHVKTDLPRYFKADGVSCEVCHGAAQNWVSEHYKRSWKSLADERKHALGLKDTKTLSARIALCLDCHVGSPNAEVNHELIAAGHPRLNFEFSAFHARWVRHWPDSYDKGMPRGYSDFEVRAWVLGQIESAGAAMKLLQARAGRSRPWLEFAELDCYACHHHLKPESPPGKAAKKGQIRWSRWYVEHLPLAISVSGNGDASQIKKWTDEIDGKMTAKDDQKGIAALAQAIEQKLSTLSLPLDRTKILSLESHLFKNGK